MDIKKKLIGCVMAIAVILPACKGDRGIEIIEEGVPLRLSLSAEDESLLKASEGKLFFLETESSASVSDVSGVNVSGGDENVLIFTSIVPEGKFIPGSVLKYSYEIDGTVLYGTVTVDENVIKNKECKLVLSQSE